MPDNVIQVEVQALTGDVQAKFEGLAETVAGSTGVMGESFGALHGMAVESAHAVEHSEEGMIAATREMAVLVKEQLAEAGTAFIEFAERAKISAAGVSSATGLIGAALGGGLILGFIGEQINKEQEWFEENAHLAARIGETAVDVDIFRKAVGSLGAKADSIPSTLTRLTVAVSAAKGGNEAMAASLEKAGISADMLKEKHLSMTDVLKAMTERFGNVENAGVALASTYRVLTGRGSDLAFVLQQGNEKVGEAIEKAEKMRETFEKDQEASEELAIAERKLSGVFKTLAHENFPAAVEGMKAVGAAAIVTIGVFNVLAESVAHTAVLIGTYFSTVAKEADHVMHGQFGAAMQDARDGVVNVYAVTKSAFSSTLQDIQKTIGSVKELYATTKERPEGGSKVDLDKTGGAKPGKPDQNFLAEQTAAIAAAKQLTQIKLAELAIQTQAQKTADDVRIAAIEDASGREVATAAAAASRDAQKSVATREIYDAELHSVINFLENKKSAYAANDPETPAKITAIDEAIASERSHFREEDLKGQLQVMTAKGKLSETEVAVARKLTEELEKLAVENQAKLAVIGKKVFEDQIKAEMEEQKAAESHAAAMFGIDRALIDQMFSLDEINVSKHIILLQASYEKEYQAKLAALNRDLQLERQRKDAEGLPDAAKVAAILKQISDLKDAARLKELQSDIALTAQQSALFHTAFGAISSAFDTTVKGIIQGTVTIARGFASMGQSILLSWANSLLQMGLKHAESIAFRFAMEHGLAGLLEALHLTTATQDVVTGGAERAAQIPGIAALGAANAFAATAAIPIVGPELAPAAAAAALGAILGIGSAAAFEQGGISLNDQMAFLHKDEMVLPAPISKGMQSMIGSQGQPGAPGGDGQASKQPDVHIHYSPTVQALDGAGLGKVLDSNRDSFNRFIKSQVKGGQLAFG